MDPRYRGILSHQIPEVFPNKHVKIKIICGSVLGVDGPVRDIITNPEYLDITVSPHTVYEHPTKEGHTAFTYVIEGKGSFGADTCLQVHTETVALFEDGDGVRVETGGESVRFLMVSGQPIREPVAWAGPIVMNTQSELALAFDEYRNGTFIKNQEFV